jgi:hypothetical protein
MSKFNCILTKKSVEASIESILPFKKKNANPESQTYNTLKSAFFY